MFIQKKNILVITELFPNESCTYLGSFVYNQLDYLKKYYNITLIVPRYFGFKIFYSRKFIKDGFTVYNMRQPSLFLSIVRRLFDIDKTKISSLSKELINKKISKLAKKINKRKHFDLIVGHESGIGDKSCFVGYELHIPTIFHLHGIFEYHKKGFGEKSMEQILLNLEKANQIISVSNVAINSYKNNGLKNQNISIIPNLIKNEETTVLLDKKWKDIIKNKKVILSVGWLVKEKKVDQIIAMAEKLRQRKDFVVLIIGQGEEENNYAQQIIDKHLENIVYIVGPIKPNKIAAFYKACDFLIHPSTVDSFSMVCLEAMSYGKPIIYNKNIGIAEYIEDGKEGFVVEPNNEQQLFEKTVILLDDNKQKDTMGVAAHNTSLKFKSEIIGEKIKEIYEKQITAKSK